MLHQSILFLRLRTLDMPEPNGSHEGTETSTDSFVALCEDCLLALPEFHGQDPGVFSRLPAPAAQRRPMMIPSVSIMEIVSSPRTGWKKACTLRSGSSNQASR